MADYGNDYATEAGYTLDSNGYYVNAPSSSSLVDASVSSAPSFSLEVDSSGGNTSYNQPIENNYGFAWEDPGWKGGYTDESLSAYLNNNPSVGDVNQWTWEAIPSGDKTPSVLVSSNLENYSELSSPNVSDDWWTPWNESQGQDAGQWWQETTKDWFKDTNSINSSGSLELPISQSLATSSWYDWLSGSGQYEENNSSQGIAKVSQEGIDLAQRAIEEHPEWESVQNLLDIRRDQDRNLDTGQKTWVDDLKNWKIEDLWTPQETRDVETISPIAKSIWFESTGDGNFTTPWNTEGVDKKWIKEIPGGGYDISPVFAGLASAGTALGFPKGENVSSPVSADMFPSSLNKITDTESSVTPSSNSIKPEASSVLKEGVSYITIRKGTSDAQIFLVNKIVRDEKTGEIKEINVTNTKLPKESATYQGGDIIDEARRIEKIVVATKSGSSPSSEPPSAPNDSIVMPGITGVTLLGAATQSPERDWNGPYRTNAQIWGGKIVTDDEGNTSVLPGLLNTNASGQAVGFNYIDEKGRLVTGTYGVDADGGYKVVSLERNGEKITDKYVKEFGESLIPMAQALNNGVIRTEKELQVASNEWSTNNHFLYNYASGQPTTLGNAFGFAPSGTLQAAVQNIGGAGNVAMDASAMKFVRVGDYVVPTFDKNTINAGVMEAALRTDANHPGSNFAMNFQNYGYDPVTGEAYTKAQDISKYNVMQTKGYDGWKNIVTPKQMDYFSESTPSLVAAKSIAFTNAIGWAPGGKRSSTVTVMPEFTGSLAGQGGYEWINQAPSYLVTALSNGDMSTGNLQSNWMDVKDAKAGYGTVAPGTEERLRSAGNQLERDYGISTIFPMLNSNVFLKYGSNGQLLADSSQNSKAMWGERGNSAMTAISGITPWLTTPVMRDFAVRPAYVTGVIGTGLDQKVVYSPWTMDNYLRATGTPESTANSYIPVRLGGRNMAVFEDSDGKLKTITYETTSGSKNASQYRPSLPAPGFRITSMEGEIFAPAPLVTNPIQGYSGGHTCGSCSGGGCTSCGGSGLIKDKLGYPGGSVYYHKRKTKTKEVHKMSKRISC